MSAPSDLVHYGVQDDPERSVLSACLHDPGAIRVAVEHITHTDFADQRLGALFSLLVGMRSAATPITPGTLHAEIARRRTERIYPDNAVLAELIVAMQTSATVGYYAEQVRGESIRRSVQALAQRVHAGARDSEHPAQLAAQATAAFSKLRDSTTGASTDVPTLGEVLEGSDDYDWVIPGLLERGDRFILTGQEGGGKTTLIRQVAICAAAGVHPFTRRQVPPVDVLYIDVENSERQWRRKARGIATAVTRIGQRDPRLHLRLHCTGRIDITTDRALGFVHRLIDEHKPAILCIGPLYKLVPRAITNDDDAAPLITALDSLRERGCTLLMEAHAGHAQHKGGDRDLRPRGSSALLGWPEFGFGVQVDAEKDNLAHLVRWRGDRDERDWPDTLARGGMLPWSDVDYSPSHSRLPEQSWNDR